MELSDRKESEENTEEEVSSEDRTELNINLEVLEQRDTMSYISLSDLYGLNVFTGDFREKMNQYQEESHNNFLYIQKRIFTGEDVDNQGSYETIVPKMFTEFKYQIIKEENSRSDNKSILIYSMSGGIIIILFLLIMIRYYNYKRKERLKNVDNFDVEIR